MKKIIIGMLASVALAVSSMAIDPSEYVVLDTPIPNANNTLIKVFSYACPFCYKYDKGVTPKVIDKIGKIKFIPYHLKQKGELGTLASEILAVALDMDNQAKTNINKADSKFKKAKMALYEAYHDNKTLRSKSEEGKMLDIGLQAIGIDKASFEKAKLSKGVKDILASWDNGYEVAKIQGVPAFIVNGKYLIKTSSIQSVDGFVNMIKDLSKK